MRGERSGYSGGEMRRFALLLPVVAACSFDATGFGEPPVSSSAGPSSTSSAAASSGGGGETTAATGEQTGGVAGSDSMTASATGGVTSEPLTGGMTTSEPGTSTTGGSNVTSEGSSSGQMCETMMVWVDADGDGYGDPNLPKSVCVGDWQGYANNPDDCNDMSPAVGPNKPEVCDQLDNDCDGKIDEYNPVSNKDGCNDCAYRVRDGHVYAFCNWDAKWDAARQHCMNMGIDLAIDNDMPEHDWLVGQADGFDGFGALRWIGGKQDGTPFKWVDGSVVPQPDPRWFGGEPNDQGIPFDYGADCLVLVSPGPAWGKTWLDYTCDTDARFTCEGQP